jgi:hypothetical protein
MNIGVSCNDAGAANLIAWYIKNNYVSLENLYFNLNGPARDIFLKVFPSIKIIDIDIIVANCEMLISGTGWSSKFEHDARSEFSKTNKKIISVLDHWVNYRERFAYESGNFLSHELWVFDNYAYEKAKALFPGSKIILKHNYYSEMVTSKINFFSKRLKSNSLLYILEPIRDSANSLEGDEFQCLELFFKRFKKLFPNVTKLTFRPHPSEEISKYDSFLKMFDDLDIQIDATQTLEEQIGKSEFIVGIHSMALYLASLSEKKVFTSMLESHGEFILPISNILELRNL